MSTLRLERVLIIKPSSLGDVIHALPVLRGLRQRHPQAKIDWLVASQFAPLLEGDADLDELILFDRTRYSRVGRSLAVARDFSRFLRDLRRRRYDVALDLQGLARTGFLAWATRAPLRIGFRAAREGAWVFYNRYLTADSPELHAVDRNYLAAKLMGFEDVAIKFDINLPRELRDEARALLRAGGWRDAEQVVAIAPGARWETKVWQPGSFAAAIDTLQSDSSVRCVLLGGPDEVVLCEQIARKCKSSPVNLAGRTSVRQLTAIIALSDAVLCQDSAAMHLAVALDRPLVCLIGPTNPKRTGPYRRADDVVRLDLDCSPCYLRKLSQCRHNHRCMRELEAEQVVPAVRKCLASSPITHG